VTSVLLVARQGGRASQDRGAGWTKFADSEPAAPLPLQLGGDHRELLQSRFQVVGDFLSKDIGVGEIDSCNRQPILSIRRDLL